MSTEDIDRQVIDHMIHLIQRGEAPETIGEMAEQLALTATRVRGSVKRLVGYGEVRAAGIAADGAKTWTLTATPENTPPTSTTNRRTAS